MGAQSAPLLLLCLSSLMMHVPNIAKYAKHCTFLYYLSNEMMLQEQPVKTFVSSSGDSVYEN